METPEIIKQLDSELVELVTADDGPVLSVKDVAKFLGMGQESLRKMLYTGSVPFGLGREGNKYEEGAAKISKLAFYNWVTQRK